MARKDAEPQRILRGGKPKSVSLFRDKPRKTKKNPLRSGFKNPRITIKSIAVHLT